MRWACLFFLFVSFWPWEKDAGEIKKASFSLSQDARLLKVVRVAVFYEKPQVSVSAAGGFEMKGLPGDSTLNEGPALAVTMVRPDPSGIRVGSTLYPVSGLRITAHSNEVEVDRRKYHDTIQVLKNPSGTLTVVNEVDVDEYLKGVLPREVHSDWPEEALKAQAVVSRTYALFKNIENKDFPFTLSSDVASQVYGGKAAEHPAATRAVEKTRGQILTYNGKIFPAYFHSTCGGRTARADYQWKIESHPSLKGVECTFCRGSPYDHWKAEFSLSEIEKLLAKKGFTVSNLESIGLKDPDISGRPRSFILRHAGGSLTISGNEFRLALGPDRLKSTRVNVQRAGEKIVFEGSGWGHGVGLCQYGARHLAGLGYRYQDILRYYYPESTIQNIDEAAGSASGFGPVREEPEAGGGVFKRWYQKVKTYVEDL